MKRQFSPPPTFDDKDILRIAMSDYSTHAEHPEQSDMALLACHLLAQPEQAASKLEHIVLALESAGISHAFVINALSHVVATSESEEHVDAVIGIARRLSQT